MPQASYLQTLNSDETIALVASLQKIKEHLSQELHWMKEQVQRKTTQLQGIETLLAEAAEPGSVQSASVATEPVPVPADLGIALTFDENGSSIDATDTSTTDTSDTSSAEDIPPVDASTPDLSQTTVTPDSEATPPSEPTGSRKTANSKSKLASKSSKTAEKNSRQAKKPGRAAKSTSSSRSVSETLDLRQFLQTQFQGQSITEAVANILEQSSTPLGLNDVVDALFDGLSDDRYKRAKASIMNILSTGKSKGKWQNTGRGLYASNSRG